MFNFRLEELRYRRHQGHRYSSLTEGLAPVAANAALGSKFTQEELDQAKIKLRQNSTDNRGSSRIYSDKTSNVIGQLNRPRITRSEYKSLRETGSLDSPKAKDLSLDSDRDKTDQNKIITQNNSNNKDQTKIAFSQPNLSQAQIENSRGYRFSRQPRKRRESGEKKRESGEKSRFEPKLDPREELMIAIRSAGGRDVLRKVSV